MNQRAQQASLVLVWHFHQPDYKSAVSGRYELPWTRLHITKDYLRMAMILREFRNVKMVFNYSPCLLRQIADYAAGTARDAYLDVSLKEAGALTEDERLFLLDKFFQANMRTAIRKKPRYLELFLRRGKDSTLQSRRKALKQFSTQDFRDLQVLFNLSWIDSSLYPRCRLQEIGAKEGSFSEEEKNAVLGAHTDLAHETLSILKELWDERKIELWVSPFYHPILPLLCDSEISKKSLPDMAIPSPAFRFPQDAESQVRKSVELAEQYMGRRPVGMWPSEGSVSDEAVRIIKSQGFGHIATDEENLAKTIGSAPGDRDELARHLYAPYSIQTGAGPIGVFFRDRVLSDLIGFTYSSWRAETAARDFVGRIRRIGERWPGGRAVVTVALDGENCWEYYDKNGADFITDLYRILSGGSEITSVLPEELAQEMPARKLANIWPGSWIGHSFRIWIGHNEKNRAWELLTAARQKFEEAKAGGANSEALSRAFEHIQAAEGSDWFWWYGDDFYTADRFQFDRLFREQLMAAYREMGEKVPPELYEEVAKGTRASAEVQLPARLISPTIDGVNSHFYEWRLGGKVSCEETAGGITDPAIVRGIYYGFDQDNLYLRIDTNPKPKGDGHAELLVAAEVIEPLRSRITISPWSGTRNGHPLLEKSSDGRWETMQTAATFAARDIVEMKIPFADLGVSVGTTVSVIILVLKGEHVLESWPLRGRIIFQVPSADYDDQMWSA
ncbi:MAG: glycoside hydrolase family 57 protein [Candidatus Eisenbacteria bacterium]|nr:glycoside hydrolase family 57 protein [Candidatus Eisenbacteria bacterium]